MRMTTNQPGLAPGWLRVSNRVLPRKATAMSSFPSHRRLPALVVAAMLALAACGSDGDTASSPGDGDQAATGDGGVVIERFMFMPEDIEVSAGTTVSWNNRDSAAHTVEDSGGLFPESERIEQGGEFSFTYEEPGEYPYICGIHTYMTGTVTVS